MKENVFCMVFHARWISHHLSPNPTLVASDSGGIQSRVVRNIHLTWQTIQNAYLRRILYGAPPAAVTFRNAYYFICIFFAVNILINMWFKGLRLLMWSLLHDTDQVREMLSTDQSLRDRRSRGLWSVLSISRGISIRVFRAQDIN